MGRRDGSDGPDRAAATTVTPPRSTSLKKAVAGPSQQQDQQHSLRRRPNRPASSASSVVSSVASSSYGAIHSEIDDNQVDPVVAAALNDNDDDNDIEDEDEGTGIPTKKSTRKPTIAKTTARAASHWMRHNLSTKPLVSYFLLSLIFIEIVVCIAIFVKVPYTEIDWKAYMQQIESFITGERDYTNISGSTGPLVYPAGFVYIYTLLYMVTDHGTSIATAQAVFTAIHIIMACLVVLVYRRSRLFPVWAISLLFVSKRIRSVSLLRLFNDPVGMVVMVAAVLAVVNKRWKLAAVFYSLALSIKMNALLFAPGFAWVFFWNAGITKSVICAGIVIIIQLVVATPFIMVAPYSYMTRAFEFSRQFNYTWTVNWRFVDERVFLSRGFSVGLLMMHVCLLVVFAATVWRRHVPRSYRVSHRRGWFYRMIGWIVCDVVGGSERESVQGVSDDVVSADDALLVLFSSNLIGIVCARSLHYQFYSWYFFTLPYLLWRTGLDVRVKLLLLFAIEWCWNVYPSTVVSSGVLCSCHVVILCGLLVGHRVYDSQDACHYQHQQQHIRHSQHRGGSGVTRHPYGRVVGTMVSASGDSIDSSSARSVRASKIFESDEHIGRQYGTKHGSGSTRSGSPAQSQDSF